MASNQDIEQLADRVRAIGGTVTIAYEDQIEDGHRTGRRLVNEVRIAGVRGVGPFPMSPIAAAERMRDVLARDAACMARMVTRA